MGSDYILPVTLADFNSACSVEGLLATVLPNWFVWYRDLLKYQRNSITDNGEWMSTDTKKFTKKFRLPNRFPRILPFFVNSVKLSKKKMLRCPSMLILRIENMIKKANAKDNLLRDRFISCNNGSYVMALAIEVCINSVYNLFYILFYSVKNLSSFPDGPTKFCYLQVPTCTWDWILVTRLVN
jgi:hypothetical protein